MRIPGSRPITTRLVTAFDITEKDVRVIRRGARVTKNAVQGAIVTTVGVGNPFHDMKAAATQVVTTAAFAVLDKNRNEQLTEALYTEPPAREEPTS